MKKTLLCIICLFPVIFYSPITAYASSYISTASPSVILIEKTTGKVLYAKNEYNRMYPASMTKILTSLVALDYLHPDDVIVVGPEINGIPADYVTATHTAGESITVRNLIRVLMIRSGNETGRILALNTIRSKLNRQNIPYENAERLFCDLMNERAKSLGALDTHFDNPYGFHSENHYTTAFDLALISRAYMENDTLRLIAGEAAYEGDSLEGREINGAKTRMYSFINHNQLLQPGENFYPYATGVKTGFTDEAGDCLSASATKSGIELIAVIFNSKDPGRWQDAKTLFDYGFDRYTFETIHKQGESMLQAEIANARLGGDDFVDIRAGEDAVRFLSKEELSRMKQEIHYHEDYVSDDPETMGMLLAPIEKDAVLGTIVYKLDGQVIFEGTVYAAEDVEERTYDSDMDFRLASIRENIFSRKAFPYWFGTTGFLIGIIGMGAAISSRRRNKRDRWAGGPTYKRNDRYRRKGAYKI